MKTRQIVTNINVTLGASSSEHGGLEGKEFPCPLCAAGLPICNSKRKKPYCICNSCGVQIFVRGKAGIARLKQMASAGILISVKTDGASYAINLLKHLEQLKLQKRDLEAKVGIIFTDENVENVIRIVDAEIEKVQGELARVAMKTGSQP